MSLIRPSVWPRLDTEDPAAVKAFVRDHLTPFLRDRMNPGAAERDRTLSPLPRELFVEAGRLGILAWLVPVSDGGLGGTPASFARLLVELGWVAAEMEVPSLLSMYADLASVLALCGRPAVKERYLGPAMRGEVLMTFAYTEDDDSSNFQTRIREVADGWILSGHKVAQTGGALADFFLVYARDSSNRLKVVLVDRTWPGVVVEPVETIGFRAAGMTSLDLQDVRVPADHLAVDTDGQGQVQRFLNNRRLYICAAWPARMRVLLDELIGFLNGRIRNGKPLSRKAAVQSHLGELYSHCLTSEAVLEHALRHLETQANPVFDPVLSATKYILVEHALQFAQLTMRLTGWPGFTTALPFQQALRGFLGAVAGQTPQEVMKILLGNQAVAEVQLRHLRDRKKARQTS